MTHEWAALAAGAAMLLIGAGMWVRAAVLLDRVEQERLDGLRIMRQMIADWERRQREMLTGARRPGEWPGC